MMDFVTQKMLEGQGLALKSRKVLVGHLGRRMSTIPGNLLVGRRRGPRFLCSAPSLLVIMQSWCHSFRRAPKVSRRSQRELKSIRSLTSQTKSAPPLLSGFAACHVAPSSKKTEPPDFDLFGSLRTY
jgi:hypothetical protein